ncbi:MAG: hypothetical protein CL940_06175 [Deltaproteobacteria bacterium]|nr:hypothetical protein [Deltaproteobacteria bacterium]
MRTCASVLGAIAVMSLVAACGADAEPSTSFESVAISDASALTDLSGDAQGGDAPAAEDDVGRGAEDTALALDGLSPELLPAEDVADAQTSAPWEPPAGWGEPVEAASDAWTWVEVEGTHCGDGSQTGFAINPHEGATTLFLYLEGGGGCWNYLTCDGLVQTSFHLGGYDASTFNGLIAEAYKDMWFFDRESDTNPLADAHYVFIPYCTGDAHAGDAVRELQGLLPWNNGTFYFKGRSNLEADLAHIVPTFSDVERVVLSGASAGGFGAGLNWPLVGAAFGPEVRVDLIDDSGPPLEPSSGIWEDWYETWNIELPQGCIGCEDDVSAVVDFLRSDMLQHGKMALLSNARDAIISAFFQLSPFVFEERLFSVLDVLDEEPNAHYFVVDGAGHTMTIFGTEGYEASDGAKLTDWLIDFLADAPDLKSHRP